MSVFSETFSKRAARIFLAAAFAVTPFLYLNSLYFPYISGKAYVFRLLVELATFFWVLLITRRPEYLPNLKNPLFLSLFVFVGGLIVTALLGVDVVVSLFGTLERSDGIIQFAHLALAFVMLVSLFRDIKYRDLFFNAFLGAAAALALYAWLSGIDAITVAGRLEGTFGNPSYLGGFMLFAIGIALLRFADDFGRGLARQSVFGIQRKYIYAILAVLFLITMLATQTRGAYLGFAAGFAVFALAMLFSRGTAKKVRILLASLLLAGILSGLLVFVYRDTAAVQNTPVLSRFGDATRLSSSASVRERLLAWEIAWNGFLDRPALGWGPENFGAAFNKFYNFRATRIDSWFDRPHNQFLQILSEGGVVLMLGYLFWLGSVFYSSYLAYKRDKLLGALFAATYTAFIVQGLFLFDTLAHYLGLFPLLALLYFGSGGDSEGIKITWLRPGHLPYAVFGGGLAVLALTYFLVFLPWRANYLTHQLFNYADAKNYDMAGLMLERALMVGTPYISFEAKRQAGWILLSALSTDMEPERSAALQRFYLFELEQLERGLLERPSDQQIYYLTSVAYRLGFERSGQAELLVRAEEVLKLGRERSVDRAEYVDELARVLVLAKKYDEAEALVREHSQRVASADNALPHLALGHLYFIEEKYVEAAREYAAAKENGYNFWENDTEYERYATANEKIENYAAIAEMAGEYLKNRDENPAVLFSLASALRNTGETERALEYFNRAARLDPRYEEFRYFFE